MARALRQCVVNASPVFVTRFFACVSTVCETGIRAKTTVVPKFLDRSQVSISSRVGKSLDSASREERYFRNCVL